MKKILAFCFFPAFVPPSNGGESRLFNFYRALSRYHHVTLLSSGHLDAMEGVVNHGANFIERRIPKDEFFVQKWNELSSFADKGDMSAPCTIAAGRFPTRLHQAYLQEYEDADVIIHEFPFTLEYDLFAGLDGKPRLYDAHNCEAELYKALHPANKSQPIHDLVRQAEQRMLRLADCVLYCNEADLESFRRLAPDAQYHSLFVPNGMLALAEVRREAHAGVVAAVFMGSGHAPNVEAALYIANELAPALPHITFDILGSCLPEGKYPANVIRHGPVSAEKKHELLGRANVALNPMAAGSGSNVKVFEYFAYGLPLLSTPTGMRGIEAVDGVHCRLAELGEFAAALSTWNEQADAWTAIGQGGFALAQEKYTWDNIVKPVSDYLEMAENVNQEARPVLVLNDYNSFTSVGGGATRTRGLYTAVAQWCPVIFICFSEDRTLGVSSHGANITVISVPKTAEHKTEQLRLNSLSAISLDDVVASTQAPKNGLLLDIYTLLKGRARAIVVEHPYMAEIPMLYGDRFIYSSQNNEALLKKRLFERNEAIQQFTDQIKCLERKTVERAAAVIAVSDEDALSLSQGVQGAGPLIVVRNGAEPPVVPDAQDLERARDQISSKSVVFLGSGHPPNIEAVSYIVRRMAPACPDIQFHIIGSVCGSVGAGAPKNIKLWGILEDSTKAAVMQACTLAVNPMSSGSGSNVKLADFLGNGLFTVTTDFGQRGYPVVIQPHIHIVPLEEFVEATRSAMARLQGEPVAARDERRHLFEAHLSMRALGREYVAFLQALEVPKKRVLLVTYRYTSPALGGAELMVENLLRALDGSGHFAIDVVAAQASSMESRGRFMDEYIFQENSAAFTGLRHTRFARFAVDGYGVERPERMLAAAWNAQCLFEREVYRQLSGAISHHGLAWGWGGVEEYGSKGVARWAFSSCGLHLFSDAIVSMKGDAPVPVALLVQDESGAMLYNGQVSGQFEVTFKARRGAVEMLSSARITRTEDPRPLAFVLKQLSINEQPLDLRAGVLCQVAGMDPETGFDILHTASQRSRTPLGIRLTDLRGPWSSGLEAFLERNIEKYDLVVTHNNVFHPAVAAIAQARAKSVPSILIPHAHLDDDYYHFPDVFECAQHASLVLAAPRAACAFYARWGCTVDYLPAGIDSAEAFTSEDVAAFRRVYPDDVSFVLVLGRKAGAKGYQQIIDAVASVNAEQPLRVVLIGPDDDAIVLDSPVASYLGRQPREVVRGALMSCLALVNMSTSESFGIVLLEAWMAGKPVVVNKGCAAFHDMAIDEQNALLVDGDSLEPALLRLTGDAELRERLARHGREGLAHYDWASVGDEFIKRCLSLVAEG